MGKRGVEPLRLAALEPKSSVSAISPLARKRANTHPFVRVNISQDPGDVKTNRASLLPVALLESLDTVILKHRFDAHQSASCGKRLAGNQPVKRVPVHSAVGRVRELDPADATAWSNSIGIRCTSLTVNCCRR